ncbi:DUF2914 domain-containing protein [Nitrospirales bacterium NOB]|nr:hypothetical protein [Nitrospirota bacterium]MCK6493623.1 DUF2914 domain-containing protein [Nitrospira sp.]MDL1889126.1 DUF2914 domain-containing protein [Nitrospirales bacterium NOB]MEB2338971.1 DUF2914 domain-containing protein [Nitrospirales bacterium]QOJ34890.1 MAG: DUF2914 domain-containing protein [Nitrospira sp.]
MVSMQRVQAVLGKPYLPPLFFLSGVTYDTLTLSRIDRLQGNLLLLLYLLLLGFLIVLTGRLGTSRMAPEDLPPETPKAIRWALQAGPYAPMAIQFLFGSLFSAYTIFYWKSATWTGSAVFFVLLVGLLVGNEFLRDRLSNLQLLVGLYALVCFAFFTFFLPVMTGWMNQAMFLAGAVLSVLVTLRVVELIYRGNEDRTRREATLTTAPAMAVIALLVGFYILNWIPPVPLSLKFGGMYHEVKRAGDHFELSFERQWYEPWKHSASTIAADEPLYCFTAVFAPVALRTTVYHHWYFRPESGRPFVSADRIALKIVGGREGGYRAYTFKQGLDPGEWRIDVETEDGRVIGRVGVQVTADQESPRSVTTIVY